MPFSYSGALHTYFAVSDIGAVSIHGLDGTQYIDQLDPGANPAKPNKVQQGPIRFEAETDRIYVDTEAVCVLDDPGLSRQIVVARSGSRSAVVWNPWIAKAARMSDFGDDEYHEMVCIETANAGPDRIDVAPGDRHRLATTLAVTERA
jgi:D-hexose-6-phosphate mutarotase